MNKIRVLIVDDHPMLREALRSAIEGEPDLEVVGEASNGQEGVLRALSLQPDVTVMDLYLPVLDGIGAIEQIIAANRAARILVITSSNEDEKVVAAVEAGARGYLLKDSPRTRFLSGLREVAIGNLFFPTEVADKLARGMRQRTVENARADSLPNPLTPRERQILTLLGEGLTNAVIAQQLHLSNSTVRVHIYNLLGKLNLQDRGQAIVYALKHPPLQLTK